jgi:hypothetical protein
LRSEEKFTRKEKLMNAPTSASAADADDPDATAISSRS